MNQTKIDQIRDAVRTGNLVECTREEYPDVRRELQKFAAESIDHGQQIHAIIALGQVQTLDVRYAAPDINHVNCRCTDGPVTL